MFSTIGFVVVMIFAIRGAVAFYQDYKKGKRQ